MTADEIPELVVEEADEDGELTDVPEERRKILTKPTDEKVIHIKGDFERGKIIIQPEFQRQVVWDGAKCSRLIESMLMGVPLPIIYVAETPELKIEVIDGQQRLAAILAFLTGGAIPDLKGRIWDGRLRSLKVLTNLNNKRWKDLSEEQQELILDYQLRVITIKRESDPDVKFEVFARLNTGAVKLNDMEIRNCVYRGALNDFVKRLAENREFREMLGSKAEDPRMKDVEMVLRFIALYELTEKKYTGRMKTDLNRFMQNNRTPHPEKLKEWENVWNERIGITRAIIGPHAFRRYVLGDDLNPNGHWDETRVNLSLYDTIMQNWYGYDRSALSARADAIVDMWVQTHTSAEFDETLTRGSDNQKNVTSRFRQWRDGLEALMGVPEEKARLFSRAVRELQYRESTACRICHQTIHTIEDAEVDHVVPWIRGGATTLSNAQLAHRACNRRKSSKIVA